ncbi:UPF0481 protein At3g47200-like isoform X1 [Bidens hawaiensis]|uniref:UPF0481 protein At3g47200-like isoform X1 n=2 Tax=Bidens hawaiensis TaxID=980011 RepID=UPI004049245A
MGDLELGEVGMAQDTAHPLLNEEITLTTGNSDLELGDVTMIQGTFQSLLDCIENEVNNMNPSPSIYMAPHTLRELSPSSFKPRMVSIGPLHKEDDNLQAFEKQKIIHLISLMSRISSPLEVTLKSCVGKAYSSMGDIKACYVWGKNYDDAEVAKMMVLDACFILEFIYRYSSSEESFLGNPSLPKTVIFDLVLLENQIPLFFLNEIYQSTMLKKLPNVTLIQFICPVLDDLSLFMEDIEINKISIDNTPHILSLLHECYKPQIGIKSGYISSAYYSALDLDRAGVKFKPNQNPKWPIDMNVESYSSPCISWCWSKPTLRMPVLRIHDFTELVLRNLIVYEQRSQTPKLITSYAFTMDMLVNTQEDVVMLVNSKVLENNMGSNVEAANMINSICKEVTQEEFFYCEEWATLSKHCNGYWPKHIARMRKTYFSSPWNIIALFAGIFLFVLTVIQTIFTINPASGNN